MSQFFKTREETEAWLKKMGVKGFTIHDDLTVVVLNNVDLSDKELAAFPVRFRRVGGDFFCQDNQLTTLVGAPTSVGGDFSCRNNRLTTLFGAPTSVGNGFNCAQNQLTTLTGAPHSVGGNFSCGYNLLTSLSGAPHSAGGDFSCSNNQLTSLSGAPSSVGYNFWCRNNQLTSLAGAPTSVGYEFVSDYSYADLCSQIKAIFAKGSDFSAGNLTAMCAEIRAEMVAEAMSSALGDAAEALVVPRRKASRA